MNTKITLVGILTLVLLVASDFGVLWEDPSYKVHWVDIPEYRLAYDHGGGYSTGRVSADVLAVGSNAKYVVAEQRNKSTDEIAYFYIEKSKDNKFLNQQDITQGPFSKKRFEEITMKLGLPTFTKRF